MPSLFEKYRPRKWEEVVGQQQAVAALSRLRQRGGLGGRAYWLSAPSGSGKTSIARLIAEEVAGHHLAIDTADAGSVTMQDVEDFMRHRWIKPIQGHGWCWLIDEAHGLRKDVIRKLNVALEPERGGLPEFMAIVFTTTVCGQLTLFEVKEDANPLCSRCFTAAMVTKERELVLPFAIRAREIAQAEGLDGQPLEAYLNLVQSEKCNLRSVLQRIEAGAMLK